MYTHHQGSNKLKVDTILMESLDNVCPYNASEINSTCMQITCNLCWVLSEKVHLSLSQFFSFLCDAVVLDWILLQDDFVSIPCTYCIDACVCTVSLLKLQLLQWKAWFLTRDLETVGLFCLLNLICCFTKRLHTCCSSERCKTGWAETHSPFFPESFLV